MNFTFHGKRITGCLVVIPENEVAFADESHDLYLPDAEDRALATEERDYYTMVNCFWVPGPARWETIRASAKQADIGTRIDGALDAIEADNPRLKGILDKRFGRAQLEPGKLGELVDPNMVTALVQAARHGAEQILAAAAAAAQAAGVVSDQDTMVSSMPYAAIVEAAGRHGSDLIVMASHGRRGLEGVLLGSETHRVLTHSSCPVLVVR